MTFSSSSPQGSFLSGFLRLRIWHVCRPRHIDYFYYSRLLCWAVRTKMRPSIEHRASSYSLLVGISQHGSCFRARPHEPLNLSLNLTQCTEYLACPHTVPLSLSPPPPSFHLPSSTPARSQTRSPTHLRRHMHRHAGTQAHTRTHYLGTQHHQAQTGPVWWAAVGLVLPGPPRRQMPLSLPINALHAPCTKPTYFRLSLPCAVCLVPSQARLRHDLNTYHYMPSALDSLLSTIYSWPFLPTFTFTSHPIPTFLLSHCCPPPSWA